MVFGNEVQNQYPMALCFRLAFYFSLIICTQPVRLTHRLGAVDANSWTADDRLGLHSCMMQVPKNANKCNHIFVLLTALSKIFDLWTLRRGLGGFIYNRLLILKSVSIPQALDRPGLVSFLITCLTKLQEKI